MTNVGSVVIEISPTNGYFHFHKKFSFFRPQSFEGGYFWRSGSSVCLDFPPASGCLTLATPNGATVPGALEAVPVAVEGTPTGVIAAADVLPPSPSRSMGAFANDFYDVTRLLDSVEIFPIRRGNFHGGPSMAKHPSQPQYLHHGKIIAFGK
jgi:hypothetical protein